MEYKTMATSNFFSRAGTVYSIDLDGDEQMDELEVNDTQANILADIRADGRLDIEPLDEWDDELRSYTGHIFAAVTLKDLDDDPLHAEYKLIIRGGYYSGANIDFSGRILSLYSGEYYDPSELDTDDIREHYEHYDGQELTTRQAAKKHDTLANDLVEVEKILDEIVTRYTRPLSRYATFSNGETIYKERSAKNV